MSALATLRRFTASLRHTGPGYDLHPAPSEVEAAALRAAADAYETHRCEQTGTTPGLILPCDHRRDPAAWLRTRADDIGTGRQR